MTITTRTARPEDIDAVWHLMRQLAEHENLAEFFVLTPALLRESCFAPSPRLELIVAEGEGGIVGYATCLPQFSPWAGREYLFLDDLYVRDELRGHGIGTMLMKHVGALALERGVDVRWHVDPENRPAQHFYRALGAQLKEKLVAYWLTDSIRSAIR